MSELRFYEEYENQKKDDPLAGVKIGSKDIYMDLVNHVQVQGGQINIHDLIVIMAGLAGYSCQAAALETVIYKGQRSLTDAFRVVVTQSGNRFVFGEAINEYLYGTNHSVWNHVAVMINAVYPEYDIPDMKLMVKNVSQNIGYADVKVVKEYTTFELSDKLAPAWREVIDKAKTYCPNPNEWPVLFSNVLQKGIAMTKGVLEPQVAIGFIMEIATYSSKLDIIGKLA